MKVFARTTFWMVSPNKSLLDQSRRPSGIPAPTSIAGVPGSVFGAAYIKDVMELVLHGRCRKSSMSLMVSLSLLHLPSLRSRSWYSLMRA